MNVMQGEPLKVPTFTPSSFVIQGSQVELAVLGVTQVFGQTAEGDFQVAGNPVFQFNLNYSVAKQLSLALTAAVQRYESDFGPIDNRLTPKPVVE